MFPSPRRYLLFPFSKVTLSLNGFHSGFICLKLKVQHSLCPSLPPSLPLPPSFPLFPLYPLYSACFHCISFIPPPFSSLSLPLSPWCLCVVKNIFFSVGLFGVLWSSSRCLLSLFFSLFLFVFGLGRPWPFQAVADPGK